jgi:hypothetical protein
MSAPQPNKLDELFVIIAALHEENESIKSTAYRYSHDEIEIACGGEVALDVRKKVLQRRGRILTEDCFSKKRR